MKFSHRMQLITNNQGVKDEKGRKGILKISGNIKQPALSTAKSVRWIKNQTTSHGGELLI